MSVRRLLLALLLVLGAAGPRAEAEPRAASSAAASAEVAIGDVDVWLAKLTGLDPAGRREAALAVGGATPAVLPGIAKRLTELKKSANRDAMGAILSRERKGPSGSGGERANKASGPSEDG